MTWKTLAFTAAASLALAVGAALARELYDDVFFVQAHATAANLFSDRIECRSAADHMRDTDSSYSNPQYGALSAMGSALDEDSLHDSGLSKRVHRAVFEDCMRHKGWTEVEVSRDDLKLLLRADARHPGPIDAWLKAHEPLSEPPPVAAAAPAPPVVKTAAATPAPAPAKSGN